MNRSRWFSLVFIVAFAVSLTHQILPHAHSTGDHKKHAVKNHQSHSHSHHSKSKLPLFAHFANADFIASTKHNLDKNTVVVLEFITPVAASVFTQNLIKKTLPLFKVRDWPPVHKQSPKSLRAPPFLIS